MTESASPSVTRARRILRDGPAPPEEALALAHALKGEQRFGYARKVLERAREAFPGADAPLRLEMAQQHALCTYRDPDLPGHFRLERATEILREADDPATSEDQETLGLAGAIEKRKWELNGQLQHLERALGYYRRGYRRGIEGDLGYTAINAAYVHDLLAGQARTEAAQAGSTSDAAALHAAAAGTIREEVVATLTPLDTPEGGLSSSWWYLTTVAEALFGLGSYEEAGRWLERAAALEEVPRWERESTARQLARLALLHAPADGGSPRAEEALRVLLGDNDASLRSVLLGKVGLALSGGGFRASLFHIGLLARLAELDVLRHVEVVSCVSGGSIVGAHYYLEVRRLLQSKPDEEITREDYVELVRRVAEHFLAGVQRNIRMRVVAEFTTNLKMILLPHYSRTQRAGELYEREIYSRVEDGLGDAPRYMDQLLIQPHGAEPGFEPKRDNWRRSAKVPILVLNATSLNTGHQWQFTATWMGEPPGRIDTDVDGNYRLRRMYYRDAPPRHQRIRLGHAVAASACVPGLFDPLALPGLYPDAPPEGPRPDPIVVRLVDGGVHDNQGTASLHEQECTTILVSDASGQMAAQDVPSAGLLGVPLRANEILMARVREEQFHALEARRRGMLLRGVMYLHLKRGLSAEPVDWVGCPEPHRFFGDSAMGEQDGPGTAYGVPRAVQRRLAAMRTDLDSFCDAEAYALMASGYRMAEHELPRCLPELPVSSAPAADWPFLRIEEVWGAAPEAEPRAARLREVLGVAGQRAFKVWRLIPALRVLAVVLAVAAAGAATWAYLLWGPERISVSTRALLLTAAVIAGGALFGAAFRRWVRVLRYERLLRRVLAGIGMALVGWAAARLHLLLFDRLYLRWGSAERVLGTPSRPWVRFRGVREPAARPPVEVGAEEE